MAFPTTGVLDDFNRANGSVGAAWTRPIRSEAAILKIVSNQANGVDFDNGGYWNASTFGPDSEVFYTINSGIDNGAYRLFLRVSPTGASANGYVLSTSSVVTSIGRVDSGVTTVLGATMAAAGNGDSYGLEAIGSSLTYYRKTAGVWGSVGSRTDGTYSAAGYIGMTTDRDTPFFDNFGGGSIGGAPVATATVPINVNRGNVW